MKSGKSIIMSAILIFSIITTTIVYSAFNTELQINGDAVLRVKEEIRITNLKSTSLGGAEEKYNSKHGKDTIGIYVSIPSNSTVIYEVEITNNGTTDYIVNSISPTSNNSNITVTTNLKVNDIISQNTPKKFTITLKNTTSTKQEISFTSQYKFISEKEPTIIMDELPTTHTKGDEYLLNPTYTVGNSGLKEAVCKSNVSGEVTNLSSLAIGSHTITCTVTANSGKTKSVSKTTTITYDIYSIENLLVNGNFENKGWGSCRYDTEYKKYGNYSCRLNGTTEILEYTTPTVDKIYLNNEHKYYARVEGYQTTKTLLSVEMFWPIVAGGSFGNIDIGDAGKWNLYSYIVERKNFANDSYQFRIDYNNFKQEGEMYYDGAMLIDLTETFGEGNEPNKEWCDKKIEYFDGTTTIYK